MQINPVVILVLFSLLSLILLILLPWRHRQLLINYSVLVSILLFNISLLTLTKFNIMELKFQFNNYYFVKMHSIYDFSIISNTKIIINDFFLFGLDGLSIFFVLLVSFLLPPVILYSENIVKENNLKFYLIIIFSLNLFLIIFFSTMNILVFYIFFEAVLVPVFLLIIFWGSRSRKILAGFYFFIYTFFGSIFFLFAIFIIFSCTKSFNIIHILNYNFDKEIQLLLWPLLAIALMVKIPMVPFHLWLPEAHVEAPTVGSVYLASLLLKLGGYGFLRILIPTLPYATIIYTPVIQCFGLISIIYCSFIILRQVDLKKIIAYSSIIHMNMAVIGFFCYNNIGIQGSIFLMLAHGITSGALFFLVGLIYDRYKTKSIFYFGGLFLLMPLFSSFFIIFSFSNIGFPGTMNFISEFLLFVGIIMYSITSKTFFSVLLVAIGLFSSVCYSIWLVNKLIFGNFKNSFKNYYDLDEIDINVLLPFVFYVIFFGLNSFVLKYTQLFTKKLLTIFS